MVPTRKMDSWELVLLGLGVHLVLFYSVFDIYFKSPLVHGMTPFATPLPSPAKRLVLFVADGLRADKFYEADGIQAPYLRHIIEKDGAWGISHTRVPTESRPGHVALIAGFYEDVSAIAKGWKENPVRFDSVFNESRYTWSWGSPDILPMFAKGAYRNHVFTSCYPAEQIDFAEADSSKLDTWVFNKVKKFFREAKKNSTLAEMVGNDRIVFFLHLLGIDTNGHSHKPYSWEYLKNIKIVDDGIKEIVQVMEEFYNFDGKTAYVMTSDHGMTNWGSHGAGDPHETLTPLVAWGAGIRQSVLSDSQQLFEDDFLNEWHLGHLKRTDVEQADVAPLMSTLIGVPFPMNSVGILPWEYLNGSDWFKAENLCTNVKQVLAQYQLNMALVQNSSLRFTFKPFGKLILSKQIDMIRHIRRLMKIGQFQEAIQECIHLIKLALQGLHYYQTYDRFLLSISIVCGFLGWMAYILAVLLERNAGLSHHQFKVVHWSLPWWKTGPGIRTLFLVLAFIMILLLFICSAPAMYYIYCLLPVPLWMQCVSRSKVFALAVRVGHDSGYLRVFLLKIVLLIAGLEILIYGFFRRELISLGLVFMSFWGPFSFSWRIHKTNIIGWVVSCLILSIFPLMPVVGRQTNYHLVMISGCLSILLGLFCGLRVNKNLKALITQQQQPGNKLAFFQLLSVGLAMYVVKSTANSIAKGQGLPFINQLISWTVLVSSFILPLLSLVQLLKRLHSLAMSFIASYLLLSISYECLFVLSLCCLLFFWLRLELLLSQKSRFQLEELDFRSCDAIQENTNLSSEDLRRAFFFVFLILTAFFGTGNIASINSFDPASVYCFLTIFRPYVMGALMLWKIAIPFLLVSCAFSAIHITSRMPAKALFMVVLLMSDIMGLHFFFLIKDSGSWLEIGTSISHYVIVMSMISFLLLLHVLSYILTRTFISL